jgi:hypothetical protein
MTYFYAFSLLTLFAGVIGSTYLHAEEAVQPKLTHTHEEFGFVVNAAYEEVFPLFGAYEERKWAEGFDPQFIHPSPAHDQQGMVFTWQLGGKPSVWANTAFDPSSGHVQYVYFVNDTMVTLIDIHVTKVGAAEARVDVVYERTALRAEANEQVTKHATDDRTRDKEWAEMINGYFAKAQTAPGRTTK